MSEVARGNEAQGKRSRKVVRPSGEGRLREMAPPERRMIWRATERPMPEPPLLVVKKGVKMCSATSGEMGAPLSETSISTESSARQAATMRIRPSERLAPIACTAFLNKLSITWLIRFSSA